MNRGHNFWLRSSCRCANAEISGKRPDGSPAAAVFEYVSWTYTNPFSHRGNLSPATRLLTGYLIQEPKNSIFLGSSFLYRSL